MSFISSRQKVLSIFKQLHKTRKTVFKGDTNALGARNVLQLKVKITEEFVIMVIREKINEEFRKNKDVSDTQHVEELLSEAEETEKIIRTMVVQAEYNEDSGNYRLNITKDTVMMENQPFDPNAELPKRKGRPKCGDKVS